MRLRVLLNEVKLGSQAPKYLELIKKALKSKTYEPEVKDGILTAQYDDIALIFNQEKYLIGFKDKDGIYNVSKDLKSIKQLKSVKIVQDFIGTKVKSVDQLKGPQTPVYSYFPDDGDELKTLVKQLIKARGTEADLNDIDVSNVTDMDSMFKDSDFDGDISKWDVSNVEIMDYTFCGAAFNGDISKWDVSNVESMSHMFCDALFRGDISKWNVSNVYNMEYMFTNSKFNCDISGWNTSKVDYIADMFVGTPYEDNVPF